MWQSADPILGEYLDSGTSIGGVFNSRNLSLFAYGHQSPIGLLDPDGNRVSPHPNGAHRYPEHIQKQNTALLGMGLATLMTLGALGPEFAIMLDVAIVGTSGEPPIGRMGGSAASPIAKAEARAISAVSKGIPGIDKPFRAANSAHPPNASLVEQMNNMKICSGTDCSEIAEKLFNASGGNGKILRVTGANGSDLNLLEYGKVGGGFKYHEVFTDGKYVYDPRLSSSPVPKGDWQQMINGLNPGATIK